MPGESLAVSDQLSANREEFKNYFPNPFRGAAEC